MKAMRFFGVVALIGLLVSGPALLMDYLEWIPLGVFIAHAAALGWLSAALAIVLYLVATVLYASGRFKGYWTSLFPLIFGLSMLGMSLIQYNPQRSWLWIVFAMLTSGLAGFVLLKTRLLYAKPLPFLAMLPILIPLYSFWTMLVIGVLFVAVWMVLQAHSVVRQ